MTTLQLNHCKFAAENSDLDKIVDYAMDKYVSPNTMVPAVLTGSLGGASIGALSTLFNREEDKNWSNALKRAALGLILGGSLTGTSNYIGNKYLGHKLKKDIPAALNSVAKNFNETMNYVKNIKV